MCFIGCSFVDKNKIGMFVMEFMEYDFCIIIDFWIVELGLGFSLFLMIVVIDIIF